MEYKSKIRFINRHDTGNDEFKLHFHNCYEIIYVLSGKGSAVIGDETHSVSDGTYCIIPPKTKHTEILDGYGEIIFIGFEHDNPELMLKAGVYQSVGTSVPMILNRIAEEYTRQNLGYNIAAQALLDLLLVTAVRETGATNKKCKDLDYIKAYIEQYYNRKISFAQLADLSGYSYDYFRHMFKQRFGVSPQEYMIDIRLRQAKRLLEKTELSCTEIAYNCGFSNSAQLTSMFKKKYKKTPTSYRITDLYKTSHE